MNYRKYEDRKSLPGSDDIHRIELPGGIIVLVRENFHNTSVVVSGYLPGGSMFDEAGKLGTAYFTSLCLMRGSQMRSFHQIYDALESVGATLGFGASVHSVSFGGKALAEDFSLLLQLISESLIHPTFPEEQVELLRGQMMAGLQIRDQNTSEVASLVFDELVYQKHPYGRPEEGYQDTVVNITRQDLIEFHRSHYNPHGMVIAVVGAISSSQAVDMVRQAFDDWQPEKTSENVIFPVPVSPNETIRRDIAIPGKFQTDVVIGSLAPCRNSPDFLPVLLGNNILGQFGLMGRIGDSVREKAGLAYYAGSSYNASLEGGSLEVSAGVNPENLKQAIDLICDELVRFVSVPVTEEELHDSQSNFIGRLPLSLESNAGVASALLSLERYNLGLDYYRQYPDLVSAVNAENILEAYRRFLDAGRLCIVSAGPEVVGG